MGPAMAKFQSLLSWISVNGPRRRPGSSTIDLRRFQSLLSWISVNGVALTVANASDRSAHVSILVVVDLGQRIDALHGQPMAGFQSLLSWISVNGAQRFVRALSEFDPGFQSLLSWISVNGSHGSCLYRGREVGFNPCCRGSRSTATAPSVEPTGTSSSFNPCCRGSRSTAADGEGDRVRPRASFNPCCRGSRSTVFGATPDQWIAAEFQSLLSWISVKGTWASCPLDPSTKCRGFNPCCRGSRSTVDGRHTDRSRQVGFNPCCRGSRSTAPLATRPIGLWQMSFNPCCRGSRSTA